MDAQRFCLFNGKGFSTLNFFCPRARSFIHVHTIHQWGKEPEWIIIWKSNWVETNNYCFDLNFIIIFLNIKLMQTHVMDWPETECGIKILIFMENGLWFVIIYKNDTIISLFSQIWLNNNKSYWLHRIYSNGVLLSF